MALKILLADDSMTAQNLGKKILSEAGYEVVAVSNGAAAVKKIAELNPHLCILDIYMPGYTGLEVCEKVKTASATARMPVLLTVGKMEPYKPEEGARVRADGVIVKPFEASELLRAVNRFAQRVSGGPSSTAATSKPVAPPLPSAPTPASYEQTVKLTREQLQEIMEPGSASNQGDAPPEVLAPAAGADLPVAIAGAPAFPVEPVTPPSIAPEIEATPVYAPAAVADEPILAELSSPAAMAELLAPGNGNSSHVLEPAPAKLPGFVDYLVSHITSAIAHTIAARPAFSDSDMETVSSAATAPSAPESHHIDLATAEALGYEIPVVDPALDLAPAVNIDDKPDPQFEVVVDVPVANATEEGLQLTSRAAEAEGVATPTDPNLSPMEGLTDAVHPLEGGRYTPPATASAGPEEMAVEAPEVHEVPAAAETSAQVAPQQEVAQAGETEPVRKSEVSEEIAAVLDLLSRTGTRGSVPSRMPSIAPEVIPELPPATAMPGAPVWMAEEVALSDAEAALSLEKEMRVAYAPVAVDASAGEPNLGSVAVLVDAATDNNTLAEDTVRDDKIAPKAGMPDSGGSPPDSAATPTQELAAAMAAAFGGALPKEELARAEETQSISEEVRRFALGDTYKPKSTGFGGAAIHEPEEKSLNPAKLAAAIGRAIDRLKPQLVAEVLKELEGMEKE